MRYFFITSRIQSSRTDKVEYITFFLKCVQEAIPSMKELKTLILKAFMGIEERDKMNHVMFTEISYEDFDQLSREEIIIDYKDE